MRRENLIIASILTVIFGMSFLATAPTVHAATPLFKITIQAPGNANIVRRQWSQIITNSLQDLGIDARLVFLGWTACYDRAITPPAANQGKTFDQGGFDVQMVGNTPGLIANPRIYFYGDPGFFAPFGQNFYLYNSTISNSLLNTYVTTANSTVREKALKDWQWVEYNDNPSSQILYETYVAVTNPSVSGYDWIYFNIGPTPQWLKKTSGDTTKVIYASTSNLQSLIPALSTSWYDNIVYDAIQDGLTEVNNARQFIPALLASYSSTSDGHTWTLNLRQNVKWQTGWPFSADDVLFTWMSCMRTQTGSTCVGYYTNVFGNYVKFRWVNGTDTSLYYDATNGVTTLNPDPSTIPSTAITGNITALDANTVQVYLPNIKGLDKPYGFFEIETLNFAQNIIPKHILERIPVSDWKNSPFNTGTGSLAMTLPNGTAYSLTGPVGTGPYEWVSYDATAQLVTLKKFDNYWNRTALEAIGQFGIQNYYVRYIADKTSALAALKNKEVDMLDPNYLMESDVKTIDPAWGKVLILEGAGRQEMAFNNRHPILGTGTGTPLGTAEAARHVRLAIDYAIPRQLIIDNLLEGYGTPGATPCLPTQLYYNSSITARPYDMNKAREELRLAGYNVPASSTGPTSVAGFILGMSQRFSGLWLENNTDLTTNPVPQRLLNVQESHDNATFNNIGAVTTDSNGRWAVTVTPTQTGTSYYRLFDPTYPAPDIGFKSLGGTIFLGALNVTTLSSTIQSSATTPLTNQITSLQNSMNDQISSLRTQNNYLIIGIVIAIIIAIIAIFLGRRT